MKLHLIENWRELALKLWSVRLSLIAAVLSALEAGYQLYFDGRPWVALGAMLLSLFSAVSRIVAQPVTQVKAAIEADRKAAAKAGA